MKLSRVMGLCLTAMLSTSPMVFAANQTMPTASCDMWTGCDMTALSKDKTAQQSLMFESDPIGLSVKPANSKVDVMAVLTTYAKQHQCNLYVLSLQDLIKGLFKGSNVSGKKGQDNKSQANEHGMKVTQLTSNPMNSIDFNKQMQAKNENKYLLVAADKAQCVKKLGFKVPLKKIDGESQGGKQ